MQHIGNLNAVLPTQPGMAALASQATSSSFQIRVENAVSEINATTVTTNACMGGVTAASDDVRGGSSTEEALQTIRDEIRELRRMLKTRPKASPNIDQAVTTATRSVNAGSAPAASSAVRRGRSATVREQQLRNSVSPSGTLPVFSTLEPDALRAMLREEISTELAKTIAAEAVGLRAALQEGLNEVLSRLSAPVTNSLTPINNVTASHPAIDPENISGAAIGRSNQRAAASDSDRERSGSRIRRRVPGTTSLSQSDSELLRGLSKSHPFATLLPPVSPPATPPMPQRQQQMQQQLPMLLETALNPFNGGVGGITGGGGNHNPPYAMSAVSVAHHRREVMARWYSAAAGFSQTSFSAEFTPVGSRERILRSGQPESIPVSNLLVGTQAAGGNTRDAAAAHVSTNSENTEATLADFQAVQATEMARDAFGADGIAGRSFSRGGRIIINNSDNSASQVVIGGLVYAGGPVRPAPQRPQPPESRRLLSLLPAVPGI